MRGEEQYIGCSTLTTDDDDDDDDDDDYMCTAGLCRLVSC